MTRYPQLDLAAFIARLSGRAEARKVSRFNTYAWRTAEAEGLSVEQADRLAGRLRLAPWEVWPAWEALSAAEVSNTCENCDRLFLPTRQQSQRFCSQNCRKASWDRRKRASDPEYAQRDREKARRYYRECGEYARAAQRRRYWQKKAAA